MENGYKFIDFGAESTRPGLKNIDFKTEAGRIESFFNGMDIKKKK